VTTGVASEWWKGLFSADLPVGMDADTFASDLQFRGPLGKKRDDFRGAASVRRWVFWIAFAPG
jgi:hypothetical protein